MTTMRITADWEGRDDEYTGTPYDKTTVRYYESVDDEGYFYEMYVRIDGDLAAVIVTPHGVSVDFHSSAQNHAGETIHTNLIPLRMFPNLDTLEWEQLNMILIVLRKIGIEGRVFSHEEMEKKFNEWKNTQDTNE